MRKLITALVLSTTILATAAMAAPASYSYSQTWVEQAFSYGG